MTYGPHTLEAYQLIFTDLAAAMANGEDVEEGPDPLGLRGFPSKKRNKQGQMIINTCDVENND